MDWKDMAGENLRDTINVSPIYVINCAFCERNDGFISNRLAERQAKSGATLENYSIRCSNCGNISYLTQEYKVVENKAHYRFVLYRTRPEEESLHESWPSNVSTYFTEAQRNLKTQSWNSASVMARSVIQAITRDFGAKGENLKQEIDDLAEKLTLRATI